MSDVVVDPATSLVAEALVLRNVRPLGGPTTDVRVQNGRIAAIGDLAVNAGRGEVVLDATGLVALPGLVDLHTHLREPGGEEAETIASGTRAAAAGGFTDVFAMANTAPVCDTAVRVRHVLDRAAAVATVRVHPVGALSVDLGGRRLAPLREMTEAGARIFSDDGRCLEDPALLRTALQFAAARGVVVAQHAQDGRLAGGGQLNESAVCRHTGLTPWPAVAEEIVVARDVLLAGETGGALHICHLSTAGSVEIVRWAKSRGWPVTAEVTPHHLMLTDELAARTDPTFKVNPPLRTAADVTALRAALIDGTIDAVATDHAPHPGTTKARAWTDAPFGMTGLETALPVVAEVLTQEDPHGTIDWPLLADRMSHAPARIGGIGARAGSPLRVGEPADLCLVDPGTPWRVCGSAQESRSANTPFEGATFNHRVVATLVEGRLAHITDLERTEFQ